MHLASLQMLQAAYNKRQSAQCLPSSPPLFVESLSHLSMTPAVISVPDFHAEIVEVEIDGGVIFRNVLSSLQEFLRAKSYYHLYGAQA
ncbi:hypothetical protein TNCV_408181 [Trichonephila clavipes]|nr:hypothetical protein TNCV_408181 [Trichonephila clavipes]